MIESCHMCLHMNEWKVPLETTYHPVNESCHI